MQPCPTRVRKHIEHVEFWLRRIEPWLTGIGRVKKVLPVPDALPLWLDLAGVVSRWGHRTAEVSREALFAAIRLFGPTMAGVMAASSSSADRVAAIITAAEEAAERIRLEAETRMEARIAEGDRAANNRVRAAEEEAADILASARADAQRVRGDAESRALETMARAEDQAGRLNDGTRSFANEFIPNREQMVAREPDETRPLNSDEMPTPPHGDKLRG